jgi:cell division protein FtsA
MSNDPNITAGLDIGTTKICCVIAKQGSQGVEIIGMGQVPSPGVRHGQVLNIEATAAAVRKAVSLAQRIAGVEIASVVVGIADRTVKSSNCTGMITLNHSEVSEQDVQRVLESAKASLTECDSELLHLIPREYRVDKIEEVVNPLGMVCSRLEVRAHIVTVGTTGIRNITKACQRAGLGVNRVVLQSLASADAVLTADEIEMGVALIDIGGGTTDIAVFKHGVLWYTAELAVAGCDITADLARQLRILPSAAEQLKLQHGGCRAERGETVSAGNKQFRRKDVVNIITARIEELITEVAAHTRRSRHGGSLVAGLVITGGTSLLPGLDQFLEQLTNVPARIGIPKNIQGLSEMVRHPAFATGVGLVVRESEVPIRPESRQQLSIGAVSKFAGWLKEIF